MGASIGHQVILFIKTPLVIVISGELSHPSKELRRQAIATIIAVIVVKIYYT